MPRPAIHCRSGISTARNTTTNTRTTNPKYNGKFSHGISLRPGTASARLSLREKWEGAGCARANEHDQREDERNRRVAARPARQPAARRRPQPLLCGQNAEPVADFALRVSVELEPDLSDERAPLACLRTLDVAECLLRLEHELGGALLERGARGVAVTEARKVPLVRGRWLLGAIDDIKTEVLTENREPGGTVRLGAPSSLADNFHAPLARLFAQRFPRVRVELSDGLTEQMTDRLLRGELDLAINDHLDYETLVVEQVFLIGPPRDPLLGRGSFTRTDFNRLPAAVLPLSRSVFPSDVPSSLRVESMTPIKQMVADGLRYGLLPFSGIHQELAGGTPRDCPG